ncbi:tetratricopeptide repeat-containing sensor histidine kinase [Taibaiella koreensis]|uniref:tetratricopeptide repeat-containing sensor histidine kinase n=1 Tax=Taibaiella koreensis TaxID=1268548 RepID=UPI001968DECC|nr:histidine kinase [Taibaiella koreensis]
MYRVLKLLLLLFLYVPGMTARAQDTLQQQNSKKGKSYKLRQASEELSQSLSEANDLKAARQYETLAQAFLDQGDNARAEEQLEKAKAIYSRLKKTAEFAAVSRKLAQSQEAQQKIAPAIANYQSAAGNASDQNISRVNSNDIKRLQTANDPQVQQELVQSNIGILEKNGSREEVAGAYRQLAESQLQQKDTRGAAESYRKAVATTGDPGTATQLQKKITDAYVADNQLDKAIALSESSLAGARTGGDMEQQIDQLRELALLYARQHDSARTESLLLEAYRLALLQGYTLKAKDCLMALIQYYEDRKDHGRSLALSRTFLGRLDTLIRADSSLVDNKLFEITAGKIRELEKERLLQQELISRKNRFNYFLIGSIAAMLVLLFLIVRSWLAIRTKNKRIALQSLRREMNPHFIFNSLNSVNQYIAENNELEANKYLTSYSGLMRNVMEHSNKDFVSLSTEIEQLRQYLDLEHLRFRDQFEYRLDLDETLDADATLVPNMLIQPHLENAIWHGLRYKEGKGLLVLQFTKKEKSLKVIITDDGIGLKESSALKTRNQKAHQSRGLTNTAERISLLNNLYRTRIDMRIEERADTTGTRVTLTLPLMLKQ